MNKASNSLERAMKRYEVPGTTYAIMLFITYHWYVAGTRYSYRAGFSAALAVGTLASPFCIRVVSLARTGLHAYASRQITRVTRTYDAITSHAY